MELSLLARIVALFGLLLLIVAGILYLLDQLDLPLGNLPGDIKFKRGNFTCAVPLVSSLIISVVLTVILNIVLYFLNK
ncbi:MAG: DUF2905 domain-containing protein [Chloroflexota bacterium]|nr:MAG: DUF2905 domain-containing protein [Chloroflexota bacterium]HDD55283.1 DUF2905 domain-containing protein [Chloroflexota bacterium]